MSKKELILVHPTALINDLFPKEGFVTGADLADNFADLQSLEARLDEGLSIQRREAVETNSAFRHLLPGVNLFRVNPEGELELFVYQRIKGIGEERLLGKHSVLIGGHINVSHCQFHDHHTRLNLGMTIIHNVLEELCEELTLNGKPFMQALIDENLRAQPSIYAYINDNSDEVGQRHLGVPMLMMIPYEYEPTCAESSAVTVGFVPLKELRDNPDLGGFDFESWAKLIINGLSDQFIEDLTQAGIAADAQFAEFKAQQAEALKALVAVGGVEGVQGEGAVEEGGEDTCSAECQAERL